MKGDFDIHHGVWKRVSVSAKDLIKKMLQKHPTERITAKAALQHKWFDNATEEVIVIDPNILETLRQYKAMSKM